MILSVWSNLIFVDSNNFLNFKILNTSFQVAVILLLPIMLNRFFWLDTHPSFADRLRVRKKLGKKAQSARDLKK